MHKPYNLFLDDIRDPWAAQYCPILSEDGPWRGNVSGLYFRHNWLIVRNVREFVQMIELRGIPQMVSFDHDLSEEHYKGATNDQTGKAAAYWLCECFLEEKGLPMPKWFVHSMNPAGAANIASVLNSAVKLGTVKARCRKAPKGWFCTRVEGHDGPCAAVPLDGALIP